LVCQSNNFGVIYRHVAWWFKSPSSSLVANESLGCFFNVAIHRRFAAEALLALHPFASRYCSFTGSWFFDQGILSFVCCV
jgi:hypothetical protein